MAARCCCLLQVLGEAEVRQLGMGLYLGVAQGSAEPLRFIHLQYTPKDDVHHKVRCAAAMRARPRT